MRTGISIFFKNKTNKLPAFINTRDWVCGL